MDTLVALGSAASFCYSTAVLFIMKAASHAASAASYAETVPETMAESAHSHSLYFESAAMILTLITVGKMLEAMSKGRTTNALKSLMKLAPVMFLLCVPAATFLQMELLLKEMLLLMNRC